MIEVIPLKYNTVFKRAFSNPAVFSRFSQDILGIELDIKEVHTEYEYAEPIGFVRSYDEARRIIVEIQHVKEEDFFDRFLYYHLISMVEQVRGYQEYCFEKTVYTIVVLTSIPQDGSIDFSCAISDFSPIDELGQTVPIYPHRLIFLVPRKINENTPEYARQWLSFIEDSLDGKMEESLYQDNLFQQMIEMIKKQSLSPEELAEIKDEAAWSKAVNRFKQEGWEEGVEEGWEKGREEGLVQARLEMAKNMLQQGFSKQQVMQITQLTDKDLEKI